jgi:hypothetical protein
MILLFTIDEICRVCRNACLYIFEEHAVHCGKFSGFKYKNDLVRDVLFDIFSHARIFVNKESPLNFLLTDPQEGRSTLRPKDVLEYGWKNVCVDLATFSLLVGLGIEDFTLGQTTLKIASSKAAKHEKACSDNKHAIIPFAFDTYDFLEREVVDVLKRFQRVMHSNIVSLRSMNVVFQRISFKEIFV